MAKRRRHKKMRFGPKAALITTGALGGAFIGGLAASPDAKQVAQFAAAGALVGASIGGIAIALTQSKSLGYGLLGGLGLIGGGWWAARTRTEILTGGVGLSGLGTGPAVQYWPPMPG
jgi:hypothetical protein